MTDHQPFLDAILAAADDDGPRLIYADFLEEHGEPERAEFIRVQVELSRLGEHPPGQYNPHHDYKECKWCCLRRRERELLECANDSWWGDGSIQWDFLLPEIRRGFVESIECTAADWLQHGCAIVRSQPIRGVRLTDRQPWSNSIFATRDNPCGWQESFIWNLRESYRLTPVLWEELRPPEVRLGRPGRIACYPNQDAALDDLSHAALLWARQGPCPKCEGEGVWEDQFLDSVRWIRCDGCNGKGSVDFRTLLV